MRPIHNTTNSNISRRRPTASDLLWASLLLLLLVVAGCTPEEDERAMPKGAISFTSEAKTKGDSFDKDSTMGIYSYYASNGDFFMENQKVTCQGGNNWTYSPVRYWPGSALTFYAYSPYNLNNPTPTKEDGIPYLSYTVPSDACTDLLISTGEINGNTVNFPFRHALTRVRIESTASDKVVTKVEFSGIAVSGTTSLAMQETITWTLNEQTGTVSKELKEEEQTLTNGQIIAEFYMLPQEMSEDTKCTVTTVGGKTETFSLSSRAWEVGKIARYTYPVDDGAVLEQDEDEYYLIESADDLKLFLDKYVGNSNYEGSSYKLTGNITVAADDIKDLVGKDFLGYLDGDGNTIKVTDGTETGIGTLSQSFFGAVGASLHIENNEAMISDLTIEANYVSTDKSIGGICSTVYEGGSIGNCHFAGNIEVTTNTDNATIGGICGSNIGSDIGSGSISNCTSSGTITVTITGEKSGIGIGGICGVNENHAFIGDCENNASVTVKGPYPAQGVGGISGCNYGVIVGVEKSCINNGIVTGNDNSNVGGICGYNQGDGLFGRGSIVNSINSNIGTITGGEGSCVGGICGSNNGMIGVVLLGGIINSEDDLIAPCVNNGYITINKSGDNDVSVGGICGRNAEGGTIANCDNAGECNVMGCDFIVLGGICGENEGEISGCSSETGSIVGLSGSYESYVGGICGDNSGEISDCYFKGSMNDVSAWYVGGICGGNSGDISTCYFKGSMNDVSARFAIGGICGTNAATISGCGGNKGSNMTATVGAECAIGGICGANDGNIEGCTNDRNIAATITIDQEIPSVYPSVGGICGINGYHITQGGGSGTDIIEGCVNNGNIAVTVIKIGSATTGIHVGGICGMNEGEIHSSICADVSIAGTGTDNIYIGYLAGGNCLLAYGHVYDCCIYPNLDNIDAIGEEWGSIEFCSKEHPSN